MRLEFIIYMNLIMSWPKKLKDLLSIYFKLIGVFLDTESADLLSAHLYALILSIQIYVSSGA